MSGFLYWLGLLLLSRLRSDEDDERDRLLMRNIQARDSQAMAQLYDLYSGLLFGLIRKMVREEQEAEDLLQEVFCKIWDKAEQFDADRGRAFTWIVSLTRNRTIDYLRSRRHKDKEREAATIDDPEFQLTDHGGTSPLESTIKEERATLLRNALQEIPDKQRRVLEISYFKGLSQREISDKHDIPLGTVKTRMRQGMIKLKSLLEGELGQI
jgi:RNA polymerase sigma-70 factor (ECF subfamily)